MYRAGGTTILTGCIEYFTSSHRARDAERLQQSTIMATGTASINEHTGKVLKTAPYTSAYGDGWDRVWSKNKEVETKEDVVKVSEISDGEVGD